MSYFARVDENGIVEQVIVAEQDFINSGLVGDPKNWIQTSYNTRGGKHLLNGVPLRKNYAGIGYQYDRERDAFVPSKPFSSWTLDEETCLWKAPKERPADLDKEYIWDEDKMDWIEVI